MTTQVMRLLPALAKLAKFAPSQVNQSLLLEVTRGPLPRAGREYPSKQPMQARNRGCAPTRAVAPSPWGSRAAGQTPAGGGRVWQRCRTPCTPSCRLAGCPVCPLVVVPPAVGRVRRVGREHYHLGPQVLRLKLGLDRVQLLAKDGISFCDGKPVEVGRDGGRGHVEDGRKMEGVFSELRTCTTSFSAATGSGRARIASENARMSSSSPLRMSCAPAALVFAYIWTSRVLESLGIVPGWLSGFSRLLTWRVRSDSPKSKPSKRKDGLM